MAKTAHVWSTHLESQWTIPISNGREREGGNLTSKRYSAIGANERGGTEKWRRRRRPDDYSSGKATGNSGRAQMTGLVDLPASPSLPPMRPLPGRASDEFLLQYILTKLVLCMHGGGLREQVSAQGVRDGFRANLVVITSLSLPMGAVGWPPSGCRPLKLSRLAHGQRRALQRKHCEWHTFSGCLPPSLSCGVGL